MGEFSKFYEMILGDKKKTMKNKKKRKREFAETE